MIRRLMPGYKGVGVIYTKEDNKQKIRYCQRCEDLFQVQSILGNRILGIGEVKQSDYVYGYNAVTVDHYIKSMKLR